MGTNIDYGQLITEREALIDEVMRNFRTWDGKMETGFKIIEDNNDIFEKIDTINLQLARYPEANRERYMERIKEIIGMQNDLTASMAQEREIMLEKMQELGKKNQVIKSYVSAGKGSLFIDKDVR